jgi:hypothetical protein
VPSLTAENVEPATHGMHCRSLEAVPSTDMPWPTAQVAHVALSIWPALPVNVPATLTAHVRSLLAVAAAVVCVPAAQESLTTTHVSVPPFAQNVMPVWHAVHVLSTVSDPAA